MDKIVNFRLLLLPFSWIYGSVTFIRNIFYNLGVFNSYTIPKKSICVGNLSVGGTGKTPHVKLITDHLIKSNIRASILSRGYGRSIKGLKEVYLNSTAAEVGDEPLFYKSAFRENAHVVVSEKRTIGVKYILQQYPENDVIILDDAFQHRAVKAGLNILITDFNDLFCDDFLLPAGNLRESKQGIKRAQLIIVSKCPHNLTELKSLEIKTKLNFDPNKIFFSEITYSEMKPFSKGIDIDIRNILLVTGIGNSSPLLSYLDSKYNVEHLKFKDHHVFTEKNIVEIHEKFDTFANSNKIIVTTEKDYMRLKNIDLTHTIERPWFYQPIETEIKDKYKFNLCINEYIEI
tara:strand:- start:18600 stop:19637 length:1038 start_codon:yes stop_codon:yes gene_type:complete